MTNERYQELIDRAERAKKLVDLLEILKAPDYATARLKASFAYEDSYEFHEFFECDVLDEILQLGRKQMISDKEKELEELLNPSRVYEITPMPQIGDPYQTCDSDPDYDRAIPEVQLVNESPPLSDEF